MTALRNAEPGYFVVITAEGEEIVKSRRTVPEGRNAKGDEEIVHSLRAAMGPTCEVVFRAKGGFR